jgi:hypothetical protein
MCGMECKSRRLVLQLQSAEVSQRWPAALYEAGRSVLMLMIGSKIPRTKLNTVHLYQHYSLFVHNKLQYTWRGDYCECVRPAQLPVLTEVRAPSLLEPVAFPGILFGGGSTNSVEDRGQRERGYGGSSPLVRGSGGSCNLVQEISFHIVDFS